MVSGKVQHIRKSQFVYTYGPGAIIESRKGSRLIPDLRRGYGRYFHPSTLDRFEIRDPRISLLLGNNAKVIEPLTNQALKKKAYEYIYSTVQFPSWKICYGSSHMQNRPILHHETKCPICYSEKDQSNVRFLMACLNGHMDDVNWDFAVHHSGKKESTCSPRYYYWDSRGSSMSDIVIKCEKCGAKTTMGSIYYMDFKCTGRYPERSHSPPENCDEVMKVMMRKSSAVWMPVIKTLLAIPKYSNKVAQCLSRSHVKSAVTILIELYNQGSPISIKDQLKISTSIQDEERETLLEYIEKNGEEKFIQYYNDLFSGDNEFLKFINEEFETLRNNNITPSSNFSLGSPRKYQLRLPYDTIDLEITPVDSLKVISLQIGYQRYPFTRGNKEPKVVSTSYHSTSDNTEWYIGYKGFGEGLFIAPSNPLDKLPDKIKQMWLNTEATSRDSNKRKLYYSYKTMKHPLFVWLHTLSHVLIRSISAYAGYSHASLRERVYVDIEQNIGGILIYTSAASADGSLGGVADLVDKFQKILDGVTNIIQTCSNDPICLEQIVERNGNVGAACYSCLFASETSCEYLNQFLDRHILLGE